jgi:hypothetical protein
MADSHERRLREMVTAITATLRTLKGVLADLPIPIQLEVLDLDPDGLDERMERTRQLIQEIPAMPDGARLHLDMALLDWLAAFDVAHIAHHREAIQWREDAVLALLAQVEANVHVAKAYLIGMIEEGD